ncbi:glycine-rich RNA-binding protein GRP1A-like [Cryptomeria japonica]|uniref:glycine-rich RNA-binding protein GRP1A-like n=1 Tax=Cryptomeria japonica TaxID=3369 RepID=UPI0027DA1E92|nr:glycine-rich RNA-binding protein GRP1A-like [Cryptomeria japonica]
MAVYKGYYRVQLIMLAGDWMWPLDWDYLPGVMDSGMTNEYVVHCTVHRFPRLACLDELELVFDEDDERLQCRAPRQQRDGGGGGGEGGYDSGDGDRYGGDAGDHGSGDDDGGDDDGRDGEDDDGGDG